MSVIVKVLVKYECHSVGSILILSVFGRMSITVMTIFLSFMCLREYEWFKKDLPDYLFPSSTDHDASIVNTDIVREICEVSFNWQSDHL